MKNLTDYPEVSTKNMYPVDGTLRVETCWVVKKCYNWMVSFISGIHSRASGFTSLALEAISL
jgi:hypothetical protein